MILEIDNVKLPYSFEEFVNILNEWKSEGDQIEKSIDYKKLTEKELRRLMTMDIKMAFEEYFNRVSSGEIKRKKYTFEEFEKMWNKRKKVS